MSENLMILVGLVAVIGIVVLGLVWRIRRERRLRGEWGLMAQRYDLKFRPSSWLRSEMYVYGLFRHHHIRIDREIIGSGRSKQEFSIYQIRLAEPWKCGIKVRNREFSDRVAAKFRGLKGYRVGDLQFDQDFVIERPLSEQLKRALGEPQVQEVFYRMVALGGRMKVERGLLTLELMKTTPKAIEMKMIVDRLCDGAEILNEAAFGPVSPEIDVDGEEIPIPAAQNTGVAW